MDTQEDIAWSLRTSIGSQGRYRFDTETDNGCWLEKVTDRDNRVHMVLMLESGGTGIANRLRMAHKRAGQLGVPLKVVNGVSAAEEWAFGFKSENGNKPEKKAARRPPPVRFMNLDEMDEWLDRYYPRRRIR